MKKMYLKYKILINGLNPIGPYTIDGFTIKEGVFEEKMFDMKYEQDNTGINLNMNLYLISCLTDYQRLSYNFLNRLIIQKLKYQIKQQRIHSIRFLQITRK